MSTIKTKFIVVSLPRTGTKSLCEMAQIMGFEVAHAPGTAYYSALATADFVADTPAFMPSLIKEALDSSDEVKFIYSAKSPRDWMLSMDKVGLSNNYNEMCRMNREDMTAHNKIDYDALYEVFSGPVAALPITMKAYRDHGTMVRTLIPADRLLVYNFSDGWAPLAEFMGVDVPDVEIPHLNQNTMFDKLS